MCQEGFVWLHTSWLSIGSRFQVRLGNKWKASMCCDVASKKGVKNALWSSAGHPSSSPWGGGGDVVLVRGKVSTWRGIKRLCGTQQDTSPSKRGEGG